MSVTDRSRARVDEALDRLRGEYGEFETVSEETTIPRGTYSEAVNRFERDGVVGGAGAWVTDERGRVLLVRPTDREGWVDPGDAQRADEALADTAVRAVRESAGVEAVMEDVLRAERYTYRVADAEGWAPFTTLNVTFRGTGAGTPTPGEGIGAADWWRDNPSRVGYEAMLSFPFPAVDDED
jgi:ADP-ribose pyrophosphatase YjhB (NUDIX family)